MSVAMVMCLQGCGATVQPDVNVGDFGQLVKATPIPNLKTYLPVAEAEWSYRVLDGEDKGKLVSIRIDEHKGDGGATHRMFTPDKRIEYFYVNNEDEWIVTAIDDLSHDTHTVYDPPLPMIPAGLKVGEKLERMAKLEVQVIGEPKTVRFRGVIKRTYLHDTDQVLITDGGNLITQRLTVTNRVSLGVPKVDHTAVWWFAAKRGLVAEDSVERVTFIVPGIPSKRKMVRTASEGK